jgi:hypothetical protein
MHESKMSEDESSATGSGYHLKMPNRFRGIADAKL